jgi:KDO2-lipid IV(A) lauroyltransferase
MENVDPTRGAVMLGAHLGNWEWLGPGMTSEGPLRGAEIVRPLDDPAMNAFVDSMRRASGVVTIERDGAGTEMMRWLKEGYCIGILADQSPRENAVPVTFFGQPCWATIAPVMAALRGKVAVHPVSMMRDADGGYTIDMYPALEIQKTGDFLRDLVDNTQRCQDALEAMIRKNPGQWLWMHRRWKRRERLEREWAEREARTSARK